MMRIGSSFLSTLASANFFSKAWDLSGDEGKCEKLLETGLEIVSFSTLTSAAS